MKRYLFIIILLKISVLSMAQKVTFQAAAQNVVAVGEQFQLTYTLNNQGTNFKPGAISGFRVLAGPSTSNSSSISVVNGKMTQAVTQTYSYVLMATKEGKFNIPAAKIEVNGKIYASNALNIEVVKQNTSNQNSGNQNSNQTNDQSVNGGDIYLKATINKNSVYLGEPVVLSFKVYTRINLADLQNPSFPEFTGFYSQNIDIPSNITLQRENINGQIYQSALLNKVLLYPQKSGKIKIGAGTIDAIIRKQVQRRGRRSVFDDFFGGNYQQYRVALKSDPITVNVKDLPENKPASYTGAVGKYSISAAVDKTHLKANDALSYTIKISGSGNIKLIEDPKLDLPHDFDVWEPTINNKINNTSSGTKGSKIYEYVIQPRHPGNFTIPAFEFSYFDINLKKFKTISTEPFNIVVAQGDQQDTHLTGAIYSKEDVEFIGKDIRYIKTGDLHIQPKEDAFFGSLNYILSFVFASLIFIIIFILKRKQIKEASDSILVKNKKAKKEAIKRMKLANEYLKKDNTEQFYEAISKGLQGYLSDKINIPISDFTIEKAQSELSLRQVPEDLILELKEIVQTAEFARYAPSQAPKDLKEVYSISIKLISELENKIKRIHK